MTNTSDDPRRRRILESATGVFLSYGFQRTTMDDIARAAEMSRPALYLFFRNKSDIYRAIAEQIFAEATVAARTALAADLPLADRLEQMLEQSVYCMLDRFANSPHGGEIVDAKTKLAGDLVDAWIGEMIAILEDAIRRAAAAGSVDLAERGYTPRGLAELFWDAIEGAKSRISDVNEQRKATRMIVRLVADAVVPR